MGYKLTTVFSIHFRTVLLNYLLKSYLWCFLLFSTRDFLVNTMQNTSAY